MPVPEGVYHAGSSEPPPEFTRSPSSLGRLRVWSGQPVNRYPVVEALRTDRAFPQEFESALQVGEYAHRHAPGQTGDYPQPQPRAVRGRHRRHHREYRRRGQRRNQRHRQVVRYVGSHAGDLAHRAQHPVPEVVVTDDLAAQPRVFRLPHARDYRSVQQRHVHRLLGMVRRRVEAPEQRPHQEEGEEYQLTRDDDSPVLLEERRQFIPPPVRERRRGRRHEQQQPYQRDPNARNQAQRGEYPGRVSYQENPERLAEAVTPVRELGKQKPGERKSRQAYYLDCYQPEQNV